MRMVVHSSPGQLAALVSVQEVTSMKDVVDNLGQGERRDRNSRKATVNVSFITYESSCAQDGGLEGKAGGYMQSQKSANVSAEAACASLNY